MKINHLSQWAGSSLLAMSLTVCAIAAPAIAQTEAAPGSNTNENVQQNNAPNVDTTPFQETKGKSDNYGWLGLFGLLGLLNLLRKPEQPTAYREPEATTSQPSDRY